MKFVRDEEAGVWLRDFVPDADRFDWDAGYSRPEQFRTLVGLDLHASRRQTAPDLMPVDEGGRTEVL
jgi:hypothetical protein